MTNEQLQKALQRERRRRVDAERALDAHIEFCHRVQDLLTDLNQVLEDYGDYY